MCLYTGKDSVNFFKRDCCFFLSFWVVTNVDFFSPLNDLLLPSQTSFLCKFLLRLWFSSCELFICLFFPNID